ncbi:hypothetical protein MKW98_028082 [Papaver atlanticum]|uniref:Uncharacterized protein n=1 Tax=Papaver atlanticum TaxID=357466 RepID=A0AAD4XN39_9MAGN|nr:hypothetical protein MKW98_028082 [Papaver atlanticum]
MPGMVEKVHSVLKSMQVYANIGVLRRHTRNHAFSTVTGAATNACAFHQAHMVIKKNVVATTTGKHKKANSSVLHYIIIPDSKSQATSSFPIYINIRFFLSEP